MLKQVCALVLALNFVVPVQAEEAERVMFSRFSVILPSDWDGKEQSGFISHDSDEYQLTLGRKDAAGDNFIAQVSIYMLPNRPGATSEQAARILAESQADASEPILKDGFWVFSGEPRTRAMKGKALTKVKTTPEQMLIIIAQDPQYLGSAQILASLRGETESARQMLGPQGADK